MPLYEKLRLRNDVKGGIYAIENIIDGKKYIGSSSNVRHRWYAHRYRLRSGAHTLTRLQYSWNKHGEEAFLFYLLEPVAEIGQLIEREKFWIREIGGELNILSPGETYTACMREKVRAARLGGKLSEETKRKMSESQKRRGKRSDEVRANMRAGAKGRKTLSEEEKQRCRTRRLGQKMPEESIRKTADALRGRERPQWVKDKISAKLMGHPVSKETIEKYRKTRRDNKARSRPQQSEGYAHAAE